MSAQTERAPQGGPVSEPDVSASVVRLLEAGQSFISREVFYRDLLNALPSAVYTTDALGKITFFNEASVSFAGRRPALGEEWCVTWKLYNLDGTRLPHDQCPMAVALREGRPVRGALAIAERPDGSRLTFEPYPTPLFDSEGQLIGAVNMLVDVTERKASEERQRLLANEVNHRANNVLTIVQSMVRLGRSASVEEFRQTLDGRVQALARAHSLLAQSQWAGADLQHLITEELAHFMEAGSQVWLSGTIVSLTPAAAQSMAMIIHELATNAARHGALSTPNGRVMIEWRGANGERIVFKWTETQGPTPRGRRERGVGTAVITRAAAHLRAELEMTFEGDGLAFELEIPRQAFAHSAVD